MDFKIGYKVRPKTITDINEVIFERWQIYEGSEQLVEVAPTESECIGYGFNYNNSKCWSLSENSFIDFNQVYNYGSNNRTSFNNSQSILLGNDNNIEQGVDKSLIVGEQNKIELNTKNGIAVGTGAEVTANNSVVLGGNDTNTGTGRLGAELIQNGNFDEIGTEELSNGDFSQEGQEFIDNTNFATDTDWGGAYSINTVTQQLTKTSTGLAYPINGGITLGVSYKIVVDVASLAGTTTVWVAGNNYNLSVGIQTIYTVGGNSAWNGGRIAINNGYVSGVGTVLNSISVKEIGQDWSYLDSGATYLSPFSNNSVTINNVSGNNRIRQTSVTNANTTYQVTYEITDTDAAVLKYFNGSTYVEIPSTVATHTFYYTRVGTNNDWYFNLTGGNYVTINSVSVKEVGQDWSFGGGWSMGDNKAIANGSQSGANLLNQDLNLITNKNYNISFNSNRVSGTLFVRDSNNNTIYSLTTGALAYNTFNIDWLGSSGTIKFYAYNYNGSITNISAVEVLPDIAPKQNIRLMYGVQSTNGSTINSYLNSITDSAFIVPDNTALYFHADVLAVRVGGISRSGATGDFLSWVERGVVINKSGTLSIERERDIIKGSGQHTNWRPTGAVDGNKFYITVRGDVDMTIEWAATINFTQIKTLVEL